MHTARGGRDGTFLPDQYTERQVESILGQIGLSIEGETYDEFSCFCPYHGNRHTPAMSISKTNGKFICFNPSCGATGDIKDLIKSLKPMPEFQMLRMIHTAKTENAETFTERLQKALTPVEFVEWKYAHTIDSMAEMLHKTPVAIEYMRDTRGIDTETLREYHVGYNQKRNLICVPMYSAKGLALGVVGRPCENGKVKFYNSPGLPTSKSLWNIHRAKRTGDVVIVCESTFDAMRISQAGYPNVVACLGGNFSDYHQEQLAMYFSTVIIMTDFDDAEKQRYVNCTKCSRLGLKTCAGHNPGRDLGKKIADKMSGRNVKWAAYDHKIIYPDGCKDAGDMTTDQIRQCIRNCVSNLDYDSWGLAP